MAQRRSRAGLLCDRYYVVMTLFNTVSLLDQVNGIRVLARHSSENSTDSSDLLSSTKTWTDKSVPLG